MLRSDALVAWIAAHPPRERDAAVERWLGLGPASAVESRVGDDGIGHHASGVGAIVRALLDARVGARDVFVDLGAGLGKVALLAHLLTGAQALGIEVQPELVAQARRAATRFQLDRSVTFTCADAREADLSEGSVYFLYAPFTGRTLTDVMARLDAEAAQRPIRVCALGVELRGSVTLRALPGTSFWLTVYESGLGAVSSRAAPDLGPHAERVANEQD